MAGPLHMYKDLLTPIKDPEKSFAIDIAQLLQDYVDNLISGNTTPNFNSAALILQGSSSIYGKKVEYLHNLALQLCNNLIKQNKDTEAQSKKDPKEREKKDKVHDPFLSIEIKPGKNLSCLRKKQSHKKDLIRRLPKKPETSQIVQTLLPAKEEKGDMFYDNRGEVVGNVDDYNLNRCWLTEEGWLVAPTLHPGLVPLPDSLPEYYDNSNLTECTDTLEAAACETEGNDFADAPIQASPDEGFGTDPASSGVPSSEIGSAAGSSQGNNTEPPIPNNPDPSLVDEGIGATPSDDVDMCPSPGSVGIENVPVDSNDVENLNPTLIPVRQSVRQALKQCQLTEDNDLLAFIPYDKDLMVRKKIQKNNIHCLPERLKSQKEIPLCCISDFCARTFFAMDNKNLKKSLLSFDAAGFDKNSKFVRRMIQRINLLKAKRKNRKIDIIEDEKDVDIEGIECFKDADKPDNLFVPFDDDDIHIDNNPDIPMDDDPPEVPEESPCDPEVPDDLPSPDISHIAYEEHSNYLKEVRQFVQTSDITERVHAWEEMVKPFLAEIEKRESFDINQYGSRILNSFENSNRKQTKNFRELCEGKEDWEESRLFMALLPLANNGNVAIEPEKNDDGTDEIFVTLLSRKMHHIELEAFGHNDGSHS